MSIILNPALAKTNTAGYFRPTQAQMQNACDPVTFGMSETHEDAQPTQAINENYAWLAALIAGSASRRFRNAETVMVDDGVSCKLRFKIGDQANLTPVGFEGTPCCVKLPEMEGRSFYTDLMQICTEDCMTDDDMFMLHTISGGALSKMPNVMKLKGSNAYQRRLDLLRRMEVFQFARQVLFGERDVFVPEEGLLPSMGIQELLSHASVVNLDGSNLIGALLTTDCFLKAMNGNWLILGNRFAIDALNKALDTIKEQTGITLLGNAKTGVTDMYDLSDDWKSDLVLLNLDHVGIIGDNLSLNPNASVIETEQTIQDDQSIGACKTLCNRIRRRFAVATDDFNSIVRITNVALPVECLPVVGRLANRVGIQTPIDR